MKRKVSQVILVNGFETGIALANQARETKICRKGSATKEKANSIGVSRFSINFTLVEHRLIIVHCFVMLLLVNVVHMIWPFDLFPNPQKLFFLSLFVCVWISITKSPY